MGVLRGNNLLQIQDGLRLCCLTSGVQESQSLGSKILSVLSTAEFPGPGEVYAGHIGGDHIHMLIKGVPVALRTISL